MRKGIAALLAAAMSASLLAGCGGSQTEETTAAQTEAAQTEAAETEAAESEAAETEAAETEAAADNGDAMVLRLASNHTEDFVTSLACIRFAELVEEKTGGQIKVECYFNAVLGEEKATIEQAQFGGIDLVRVNVSPLAEFVDDYNAILFPYIFESSEHFWKAMDSEEVGKAMLHSQAMLDNNLYGLCFYDNGTRNFFFSEADVHGPADLEGLTVRVQESSLMLGMVEAMGANPTAMAASELYSALQTGVIDGAENNLPWYLSMSLNEVAPKIVMDEHNRSADDLVISKATMDKLTDEQMQAIQEAADESSLYQRELWTQSEEESIAECEEKGCTIYTPTDEERQQFMDSVKELNATEGEKYADYFTAIEALK